jgi:hypothetical protein
VMNPALIRASAGKPSHNAAGRLGREDTYHATREGTITENTDLGIGMLVAESKEGTYQPVGAVSTVSPSSSRMRLRMT